MRDLTDIYNWRRVSDRLTTSGQPTEAQLAEIQKLGVTHVVNLGMHDHERALADEGASVAVLGMTYVHIPVVFDNPTEEDFKQFCAALSVIGDAQAHVHCIANYRVTAFLYRYQRDVLRIDDEKARAAMESVWRPGGAWAKFIGDEASVDLPHRPVPDAEPK
jgi:protein tyrosine phosphatase (PTP) superfamily phosphohydrolase (DUF442 family)